MGHGLNFPSILQFRRLRILCLGLQHAIRRGSVASCVCDQSCFGRCYVCINGRLFTAHLHRVTYTNVHPFSGLNIVLFLPFVPSKLLVAAPFIIPRLLGSTGRRSPIMLTSFIRRNGKKKGPKQPRVWPSSRSRRPPTSPESFESPEILDINEKSIYAPPEETYGPFVQLDLSTEPWFPEELLHARRISRASAGFLRNSGVAPSRPEQESIHDLPSSSGSPKPVVYLDRPAEVRFPP